MKRTDRQVVRQIEDLPVRAEHPAEVPGAGSPDATEQAAGQPGPDKTGGES